jgi:sensor histidine kinase YesM
MSPHLKKWLFDYKLLHVFFWTMVGLFLFISDYDDTYKPALFIGQSILVPVFSCIPFYTAAYYFVPKYLYARRYFLLISLLILFNLVLVPFQVFSIRLILSLIDEKLTIIPEDPIYTLYMAVWNNILCIFIGGGLKIISDRFKLENEKIKTELDYLRAQINPHFLFNVINTVYFQIDKTNHTARKSIEMLAELLRYQLYECVHDSVPIENEMLYLKNYVEMQALRFEKGTDIKLLIDENIRGFSIAPLLLQPLIENAFKHASHFKNPSDNKIHIKITLERNELTASVINTFEKSAIKEWVVASGGIGFKNLQRRLQLLYPGNFSLQNVDDGISYQTRLWIKLRREREITLKREAFLQQLN